MIRRVGWMLFVAGMLLKLPASVIASENAAGLTIHVVQRGENFYGIAVSYGATAEALARLNSLVDPESLEVGQRLLVPARNAALESPAIVHVVQAGETLQGIADDYGRVEQRRRSRHWQRRLDLLGSRDDNPSASMVAPSADIAVAAPLISLQRPRIACFTPYSPVRPCTVSPGLRPDLSDLARLQQSEDQHHKYRAAAIPDFHPLRPP
jgi:murein DD-endopeptidase MepM/ murein hydrolase activator NlpD